MAFTKKDDYQEYSKLKCETTCKTIKQTIILTTAIEALCLILRYGFNIQAISFASNAISAVTFGLRIHHGYLGALLLLLYLFIGRYGGKFKSLCLIFGLSLLLSDVIHHFAVLWPLEGSPQFDFTY